MLRLWHIVVGFLLASTQAVFIDKGFPYKNGPLNTTSLPVTKAKDGSPHNSVVYYPSSPGVYSTFFFITGFNGVVPSMYYSDYLSGIASHGFVAISTDLVFINDLHSQNLGFHFGDLYIQQLTWMQANLGQLLSNTSPGVANSWEDLSLGSHSAGADSSLYMVVKNHTMYKVSNKSLNYLYAQYRVTVSVN